MKRVTKISIIRGTFFAVEPSGLKKFGDIIANTFSGSIVIGDVLQNREGDYRLSLRVYQKEVT